MKVWLGLAAYVWLVLVYAFVIGPAAVIIFGSFNSATSFPSPFESLTTRWYATILGHEEFIAAMRTSGLVATLAALVATVVALPAAYAFVRNPLPGKNALSTFFLSPLIVPQIVIGLAMLQLLSLLGFELGLGGLVVVHAVYVMPFAFRLAVTSLTRFDFALEEAARSLGASRLRALWHVTLPLVRTGVLAGFVFAFILSFVNLPLSLFLTSPRTTTLPIQMFAYMESRIDPLVAAVGSAVILAAVAVTLVLERVFKLRLLV